ncbi:MAG: type II toxin-antitoxin system VapC family toxin [Candidatus Hodarchaeales archaeon]
MLLIDSQIWIYYFDPNAKENRNVTSWMEGANRTGILYTEEIALSAIIPMEIGHNLFRISKLDRDTVEELLLGLVSMNNCKTLDIDQLLVLEALKILKKFHPHGIGGRDSLILATMRKNGIKTIVTHDKNILAISDIKRIDPVFDPPLEVLPGEGFDHEEFEKRLVNVFHL